MKIIFLIILYAVFCSQLCFTNKRTKRKIIFPKTTKFFLRVNGKEPILPFTTIFQHGWGFRANWELPDSIPKLHKLFRRDVGKDMQEYLERPELHRYLCVFKYFANTLSSVDFGEYCGVMCEITNIIKSHKGPDVNFYKTIMRNFASFDGDCPNTPYELSFYTDV